MKNIMKRWVMKLISDPIWWQSGGSTLAQVMACCLMTSSHYLKQCWLIISEVQLIHMMVISQEISEPSIIKISLKITYPPLLNINGNLPEVNELNEMLGLGPLLYLIVMGLGRIFRLERSAIFTTEFRARLELTSPENYLFHDFQQHIGTLTTA